jgi:AGCS family alanine or glycine:cation symporter
VQIGTMLNLSGGATGFVIGLIMALLVGVVIIGGIKRIAKITEKIVPFMAVIYIVAALIIIFSNIEHIGAATSMIFSGAFDPMAGLGGVLGVIIVGFQRAAFSNEAGAGSAAIARSRCRRRPVRKAIACADGSRLSAVWPGTTG